MHSALKVHALYCASMTYSTQFITMIQSVGVSQPSKLITKEMQKRDLYLVSSKYRGVIHYAPIMMS